MAELAERKWKPKIFVLGHPLLDIIVPNGEDLLKKYNLLPNDAIQAEERHMSIYEEAANEYDVTYVAGGTANVAQAAAYVLPAGSVFYTGSVGDDDLKDQLSAANTRAGVLEIYDVRPGDKTGACAVIITGAHRSLVTTLRAARQFNQDWLDDLRITSMIACAELFYAEGYFLTHGVESLIALARRSAGAGKVFALNISAPFVPQFYKSELDMLLILSDIIICNEAEARAWGKAAGITASDIVSIASSLAASQKINRSRPRIAIVTQGSDSTILATGQEINVYPVNRVPDSQIVDTNGAGDAFAGGFLAAYVTGKPLEVCIEAGHKMGALCVQSVGFQLKWPKELIL